MPFPLALPLIALPLLVQGSAADEPPRTEWTVWAERALTAPGEAVEDAAIVVRDGKIVSITGGTPAPEDEDALRAVVVTTGMIDASVRITLGSSAVEQTTEVQPHRRAADAVDLFDPRWEAQARRGVTTVLLSPPDDNVIGGLGVVLKTAGGTTLDERVVAPDAVLRGAIGGEPSGRNRPASGPPSDHFNRRPTTRMGVEWEWRKAMYDAQAAQRLPERDYAGSEIVRRAMAGELPLMIQAWATQDIRTAVFLKEEMQREGFGELRLIVDAAAEAWKEPQLLVRSGAAVVLPPFPSGGRTAENAFFAWNAADQLVELGIPVALSAHGSTSPSSCLAMQAGYAMRGGLDADEALAAVTLTPARLLGVDGRLGSLAAGKDADLVLWSGEPFQPTSRVAGVLAGGELVLDPRSN